MSEQDWYAWHEPYGDPDSALTRRLLEAQRQIGAWLDAHPDRSVRVVSMCAGQGRDLLEVLAGRPDAGRVAARLVELDGRNVAWARRAVKENGLDGVEIVQGDAGSTDSYEGAVPADLVLVCGVFGNIDDDSIRRTVAALPHLCAEDATVIWTRHRRAPDLTPAIRRWFADAGFDETAFVAPEQDSYSVGVHRLVGSTERFVPGQRLFAFATRPPAA